MAPSCLASNKRDSQAMANSRVQAINLSTRTVFHGPGEETLEGGNAGVCEVMMEMLSCLLRHSRARRPA